MFDDDADGRGGSGRILRRPGLLGLVPPVVPPPFPAPPPPPRALVIMPRRGGCCSGAVDEDEEDEEDEEEKAFLSTSTGRRTIKGRTNGRPGRPRHPVWGRKTPSRRRVVMAVGVWVCVGAKMRDIWMR